MGRDGGGGANPALGVDLHGDVDPAIERAAAAAPLGSPDPPHSRHVADLSLSLFDQLRQPFALPPEARALLAAAALWHDIGQRFTLPEHHLRAFDMIVLQPLPGFSADERLVIANVARYHRQSLPSLEHAGYRNLRRELRPLVGRLAAVLRLAEALDASHLQLVQRVTVRADIDTVEFLVYALEYPMLEIERAQARSGLFRQAFGRETDFEWRRGKLERSSHAESAP